MRPIDNLRLLLEGESPAWIPFTLDVGATPGFSASLLREFRQRTGTADVAQFFGTDTRSFTLRARFGGEDPRTLYGPLEGDVAFDEWGVARVRSAPGGPVQQVLSPLAAATATGQIETFLTPVIETPTQAGLIGGYHAAGLPVLGAAGSILEWAWWLRGREAFAVDLAERPTLAEAVLRKVEEHTVRLALATAKLGVDVLCFYDDAGTQRGMALTPALWRRFIKPAWIRVLDMVRGQFPAVRFLLHSYGKLDAIVPDIVDLGFDVLHPLQPECLNFAANYEKFGHDITLCATVSTHKTLLRGTPDDVRRELRRQTQLAAAERRCLVMPSGVIPPETPWENILALVEEAKTAGTVRVRGGRSSAESS